MENLKKNYLSNDLADAFSKFTTRDDLSEVQKKTGVSVSTLVTIRKQEAIVTERSETAVVLLAKKAFDNAASSEKEAKRCAKSLKAFLDCI